MSSRVAGTSSGRLPKRKRKRKHPQDLSNTAESERSSESEPEHSGWSPKRHREYRSARRTLKEEAENTKIREQLSRWNKIQLITESSSSSDGGTSPEPVSPSSHNLGSLASESNESDEPYEEGGGEVLVEPAVDIPEEIVEAVEDCGVFGQFPDENDDGDPPIEADDGSGGEAVADEGSGGEAVADDVGLVYDDDYDEIDEEGELSEGDDEDHADGAFFHQTPLKNNMVQWGIRHNITRIAFNDLLKCVGPSLNEPMPRDCRKLRGSMNRKASDCAMMKTIGCGRYYHMGLERALRHILRGFRADDFPKNGENKGALYPRGIEIQLYIDGVAKYKAPTNSEVFWPILVRLCNVSKKYKGFLDRDMQVVGLFYGRSKPSDCEEYLSDTLRELKTLLTDGLLLDARGGGRIAVKVHLESLIADHQARCFLLCTKPSSGYGACERCNLRGLPRVKNTKDGVIKEKGGICYVGSGVPRTDASFRAGTDTDHHTDVSPLLVLTMIDMSRIASLDYMHMICLGVVKRLLNWLLDKKIKCKAYVGDRLGDKLSELHNDISKYTPVEFRRKSGSLKDRTGWKATQYRHFILYTAAALLVDRPELIKSKVCKTVLLLYCAMRILCDAERCVITTELEKADFWLKKFTFECPVQLGTSFNSFNVHSASHLAEEVEYHKAPLDDFSAFRGESFFGPMVRRVTGTTNALESLVMRLWEHRHAEKRQNPEGAKHVEELDSEEGKYLFKNPQEPDDNGNQAFGKVVIKRAFTINCQSGPDRFCIMRELGGTEVYIKVDHILHEVGETGESATVVGRELVLSKGAELFTFPRNASTFGIRLVRRVSQNTQSWPITNMYRKLVLLPTANGFSAFPLLHTTES